MPQFRQSFTATRSEDYTSTVLHTLHNRQLVHVPRLLIGSALSTAVNAHTMLRVCDAAVGAHWRGNVRCAFVQCRFLRFLLFTRADFNDFCFLRSL